MFFCFYIDTSDIYLRMPKKSYKPYLLPSNFNEMENHIIKNKITMMEQVLDSVNYALSKKLKFVEVFKFTNSDFIITLTMDKFKENIDNIFEYYIQNENYELCDRLKKIEKRLLNEINSNEKQKETNIRQNRKNR